MMSRIFIRRPQLGVTIVVGIVLTVSLAGPWGARAAVSVARTAAVAPGKVAYNYDGLGRLSKVSDLTGASATYAYDAVGNLIGITRAPAPASAAALRAPSAAERSAELEHDSIERAAPTIETTVEKATATGHQLVINGADLATDTASARVKVDGLLAHVLAASSTQVVVAVPAGVLTTGAQLSVSSEGGTAKFTLPGTRPPAPAPAPTYSPLQAAEGVTALAGMVQTPDGAPLRGVTLEVDGKETTSQRDGRFLLTGLEAGHSELEIDGSRAKGGDYGSYEHGVDLKAGRTTALSWITWLTKLDGSHGVSIPTKVKREIVITAAAIPGLEVHVPVGTKITGEDGKRVRKLSITKLDLRRMPFPSAPGMPLGWTLQPGLSDVSGSGLSVVYPNVVGQPAGTTIDYVNQDGERPGSGWAVYGSGRVTADGKQISPDAKTRLHKIYQLSVSYSPPCQGPCVAAGGGPSDGDPVDLWTGQLVMAHTDLLLPDVKSVALVRTYHQNDNVMRSFGLGMGDDFTRFIFPDSHGGYDIQMPDGSSVAFAPGTDGLYHAVDSPTDLQGATMVTDRDQNYQVTFPDGRVWTFGGYTAVLQSESDRYGNITTYTRDYASGRVARVDSPNGKWIATTWGACGTSSQCIVKAVDNIGRTVKFVYDASGRLTSMVNPVGKAITYTWTACTDPVTCTQIASITDPNGVVYLQNTYDANNRIVKQIQADHTVYAFDYSLNPNGTVNTTTTTDPQGAKRLVQFNAQGYSVSDIQGFASSVERVTTTTRAPGTNRVTAVVDPLGRKTTSTYDAHGNVLSTTTAAGTASAETRTFTYETVADRVTSMTNALGKKTTIGYDDDNQTVTVTDPLARRLVIKLSSGQPIGYTDPLGNLTTVSYLDGDPVALTGPLGNTSTSYFDPAGRQIKATDPLGRRTTYRYDLVNNLMGFTDSLGHSNALTYDANNNPLTYTDPLGRVTKNTYTVMQKVATSTDPLGRVDAYTYGAAGSLASHTDRNGMKTVYGYDLLGQLSTIGYKATTSGGTTTYQSTVNKTHDKAGRLTKVVDSISGTLTDSYDLQDRLVSESTPYGAVSYSYDAAHRRTGMTVPGQTPVSYTYNAADQLTSLTRGSANVSVEYDSGGRRQAVTLPGGLRRTYSYDAASRVTGLSYSSGVTAQGNLTYQYDAGSQVVAMAGSLARANLPAAWSGATYNAANQLTALGARKFTYDADGQLLSDGSSTYTWNPRNQLTGITGPTAGTFSYDPFGRRSAKTIDTVSTAFVYDVSNVVQERSGSAVSADFLTGGLDETYARTQAGVTSSYLTDRLGSTIALVNSSGLSTTSYTYEPFGKGTASGAATSNSLQYTGRENDGNGLQYNRNRYYSPSLQRFISQDPLGRAGSGDNLYQYVNSEPISSTDPFGLSPGCDDPEGDRLLADAGGTAATAIGAIKNDSFCESGGMSPVETRLKVYAHECRNGAITGAVVGGPFGPAAAVADALEGCGQAVVLQAIGDVYGENWKNASQLGFWLYDIRRGKWVKVVAERLIESSGVLGD